MSCFTHVRRNPAALLAALAVPALFAAAPSPGAAPAGAHSRPAAQDLDAKRAEIERLRQEGMKAYGAGDYAACRTHWQEGARLAREIGDRRLESKLLNNVGILEWQLKALDRAAEVLGQSAALARQLQDDWETLSLALNNLGQVEVERARYPAAHAALREGIDHIERHVAAPRRPEDAPRERLQAKLRLSLAQLYNARGQGGPARDEALLALGVFQRGTDPESLYGQAAAYNSAAIGSQTLGRYAEAAQHYEQALALFGSLKQSLNAADTHNNMGNLAVRLAIQERSLGREKEAGAALRQAEAHYAKAIAAYTEQGAGLRSAWALGNLANCSLLQREPEKALASLEAARKAKAAEGAGAHDLAQSDYGIAQAREQLGRAEEARAGYLASAAKFEELDARLDAAYAWFSLGELLERMKQPDEALAAFEKARLFGEMLGDDVNEAASVGSFQAVNLGDLYGRAARLLAAKGRPEAALEMAERGRAWGLSRQAGRNMARLEDFLSAAEAEQLKTLTAARDARARETAGASPPGRGPAAARLREAESALQGLRGRLLASRPEYLRLNAAPPPTADQLKALATRNPDTLYLEYLPAGTRTTLLFALSHTQGLKVFTIPAGEAELRTSAEAWWRALSQARTSEAAAARRMDALLLSPARAAGLLDRPELRRLVVVPAGPLHVIPFGALQDVDGRRLLNRFAVSSSVSLGALTWPVPARKPSGPLLCAVDPVEPGAPSVPSPAVAANAERAGFGPLKNARAEAKQVVRLFPGAVDLPGKRAREAVVKEKMPDQAVLHFATHGVVDRRDGLRSWLLLADEPAGSPEDGRLEAREIASMKLSARLAVLSACETGLGQSSGGDGLLGLAWAFRAAGCPSVLASQWQVDDQATGRLMTLFYKNLLAGRRKDDALRQAMLTLSADPALRKPFYWAGFQVMGDTVPIAPPRPVANRTPRGRR